MGFDDPLVYRQPNMRVKSKLMRLVVPTYEYD